MNIFKTNHFHLEYLNKDLGNLSSMAKVSYGDPLPNPDFIKGFVFNDVFIKDNYLTFIGKNRANKDESSTINIEDLDFYVELYGGRDKFFPKKQSNDIKITQTDNDKAVQYSLPNDSKNSKKTQLVVNFENKKIRYNLSDFSYYILKLPKGKVVLNTIFWNNWNWVSSWVEYYLELGVDHILLYFTGVVNKVIYSELEKYINDGVLTLFEWNFPIGHVVTEENPYPAYAQHLQMMHSLFLAKDKFDRYLCMDPDEYLVLSRKLPDFLEKHRKYDFIMLQGLWTEIFRDCTGDYIELKDKDSDCYLPFTKEGTLRMYNKSWKNEKLCIQKPIKGRHRKDNHWTNIKNMSNPNVDVTKSRLHTIGIDGITPTFLWSNITDGFYFHFSNITKRDRRKLTLKDEQSTGFVKINHEWTGLTFDEMIKKYREDGFGE
jgi:hypothetical protein